MKRKNIYRYSGEKKETRSKWKLANVSQWDDIPHTSLCCRTPIRDTPGRNVVQVYDSVCMRYQWDLYRYPFHSLILVCFSVRAIAVAATAGCVRKNLHSPCRSTVGNSSFQVAECSRARFSSRDRLLLFLVFCAGAHDGKHNTVRARLTGSGLLRFPAFSLINDTRLPLARNIL